MNIILTFTLLMIPDVVSSTSVTGYSGSEVMIKCTYDKGYRRNTKYFCKRQWLVCSDLIKTDIEDKWVDAGRFSLYDDTRSAVFTVTIRNLTELDSDTYYCAVDIPKEIDFYTEVNLNIITEQNTLPPSLSTSSSPSSIQTTLVSLSSQPSSTSSGFTSALPSISNGSSLIIGVSVILLLLITVFVSCTVTLYKRHTQDPDSASEISEPGTENSEAVHQTLYEEIKDTRLHTDCKTTQLPIKPSDSCSTVYDTSQLPINPAVKWHKQCNNQLPTNPSETRTIYATSQLPITPSDTNTVYANIEQCRSSHSIILY
ncbi:CMRF35-like molecule 3 [Chanodichthys erythropterus]|uniref:CMRF35-like molecule 3 n=1 Tax=Chanodichthys erythropterus TaxID=933992 RepID=UPI00351DD02F